MICVYAPDATDFSTNGLGVVDPHVCRVTETLNGEWELTLEHMIDDAGKWARLAEGNILRAPVPAAMTPRTATIGAPGSSTEIWKITGGNVRLRAGAGTNHKRLKTYKRNDEMIVVNKSNANWYECIAPDGKRGYMAASYLQYVRTETVAAAVEQVVEPKQLRDQPFRIYRIVPEMDKVKVYARHVFYDLMDNMIQSYKPAQTETGAQALAGIAGSCLSEHDFTFASDLTSTAEDVEFEAVNPVEAILGADGLIEKYGGELARDWYDVYVVERVGNDSGVQVREGKNLLGISYDLDLTDVVTRIMPTGTDKDGKALYLPEVYIDSPNIGEYTSPKWIHMPVAEAQETTTGDDKKTKEQCYTIMRDAVAAEYENGCDLPTITLKVDFINCADTEEYKQYAALQNIYIGDGVRVLARRVGIAVTMRMTQYKFDCLTRKYTDMTLGTVADTIEGNVITARQLPNGVIRGGMIARGSVGAGQMIDGSIGALQIGLAAIDYAHIQQATINALMANSIEALKAKINEIIAGTVTTDELYAGLADIITLRFGQAVGGSVQTDELRALYADLLHGEIGTANIGFGQVKDLIAGTQIFTEGTGGKLFVTRLAVTDANMVHLTVGELVVKGTDGKFYAVTVAPDGTVSATEKTVEGDNIAERTIGGIKLLENTITATEINVESLFADAVLARKITTAMLAVGAVEAINIKSGAVETTHLAASTIESLGNTLNLTANETLQLAIGQIQPGGANLLRNSTLSVWPEHWATWSANPNAQLRLSDIERIGDDRVFFMWSPDAGEFWSQIAQKVTVGNASGIYPGDAVTVSADIKLYATLDQPLYFGVRYWVDGIDQYRTTPINQADLSWDSYRRVSHTEILPANCTEVRFSLQMPSKGAIYIAHPKLERGNKATGWSPHPQEFEASSYIRLAQNQIKMVSEQFLMAVPGESGEETKMQVDGTGATFETLYSPDVSPRYDGAANIEINPAGTPSNTVYTSLSGFLAELNGRMIDKTITVSIAPGATLNENIVLWGVYGGGVVNIRCTGRATVNGLWYLSDCAVRMSIDNLNLASRDATTLSVTNCRAVKLNNLHINANNTPESAVQMLDNSGVEMTSCEVYNALRLIRAHVSGGRMVVGNVKGGHQSLSTYYSLTADAGSEITCYGTRPGGTVTEWNGGQIHDAGTTIDTGSAPSPTPVQTTKDYNATLTGWHQQGWSSETQMRQGYTNTGGAGITGCMWFNNTTLRADLSGKTIKSATLRLYRKPSGRSNAIDVYLYGTIDANKGGNQVRTKNYGKLGTIARSTSNAFAIPVAAITDLRAGTINGLYLWTGETSAPSRGYSDHYGTFGGTGDGADRIPQLTVTYE